MSVHVYDPVSASPVILQLRMFSFLTYKSVFVFLVHHQSYQPFCFSLLLAVVEE